MSEYIRLEPGEKVRIAIIFQDRSLWTAIETFCDALIKDDRYTVKFFVTEKSEFTYESQSNFLSNLNFKYTEYSFTALTVFKPHAALLQTPYDYTSRTPDAYSLKLKNAGIRIIYIPYGIEIVDTPSARYDHFRMPVIKNAFRLYVTSEEFAKEYRRYSGNDEAIRVLGHPRFDGLIKKSQYQLQEQIAQLSMGRKIIVWHVHFPKKSIVSGANRQITPYLDEYIQFAQKLVDYPDFLFVFQPHPKFGRDLSTEEFKEQTDEIFRIVSSAPNAYIDSSDDYHPVLLSADAFITDRSSLMIEAAACDIPILFLKNPDWEETIFPPLAELVKSYCQGTSYKDAIKFIEEFRNGNDINRELRNACFRDVVNYFDGNSGKRIVDELYDSISLKTVEKKPEMLKLVLFGTGFLFHAILENFRFPTYCQIVALSDNDRSKWGNDKLGYPVIPPKKLHDISFDKIIILVNGLASEHIYKMLRFDLEIPEEKIEFCDYLSFL